ncbi:MAG: hypothetical protein AAFQ19_04140 [Pseudomonadota bacterium]
MMDRRPFRDEELTAYLDGEAEDALRAEIDAALETDAALAAQLAALDIPMPALTGAYAALLAEAPPMPALPNAPTPAPVPTRRWGWTWGFGTFATGLAAGAAVAVYTGLGVPAPEPKGWAAFVASYQSLYTAQTLANDMPDAAERAAQLATVSDALGFDLTDLPEAEGLSFRRAQVLGFRGKPLIQIAYLRADGTPVALCIIPAGPDEKPVRMGAAEGMDIARWNAPGFGFLLIGGDDAAPLAQEAETFRQWSQTTDT